ncbi:hypothetical protein J4429_06510 [Candidatus Pacearchaeota archaeon]|nr:hypothetical protein [Candidatus Pacearchaeota archaeon]
MPDLNSNPGMEDTADYKSGILSNYSDPYKVFQKPEVLEKLRSYKTVRITLARIPVLSLDEQLKIMSNP